MAPAFSAAHTLPLAQVGMEASSEKPVTVAFSRGSRPTADMARVRNWARETVWSGSKKYCPSIYWPTRMPSSARRMADLWAGWPSRSA